MRIDWKSFTKKYTRDKDTFPFGIRFYDAVQGGGKTLSIVHDACELKKKYPDMKIISNVKIKGIKEQINFTSVPQLIGALTTSQFNKHTLVIIDEGLTYFAENGGIDPAIMNKITQNRKCRRLIMIATQKFTRVNNRIRDFSLETVICKHLGPIQINVVRDDTALHWDKQEMDYVGDKKYIYVFKRNKELFEKFDTMASINIDTRISTAGLINAPAARMQRGLRTEIKVKRR